MIHPSYVELMKVVNDEGEIGEEPVVNSRYSIVLATAKRARQIIAGAKPLIDDPGLQQAAFHCRGRVIPRRSKDCTWRGRKLRNTKRE